MQNAFSAGVEFTPDDLLVSSAGCVPLAQIAEAQIDELKTWTIWSGAKSASVREVEIMSRYWSLEVGGN